ncbi:MAG: hypothetical protein NDI87_12640 [Rhodoferax sp.]|nr:type ISP restriction/modification enzyme [Rhodoferax sp.]MCM2341995.1 hypothetical protein [Rhodoferax sp.]
MLTHRTYQQDSIFPIDGTWENKALCFVAGNRLGFAVVATCVLPNYAVFSLDPSQSASLYRYDETGNRVDNITDWALKQFTTHYAEEIGKGKSARKISKEAIFHYCYAVLHDPLYRENTRQTSNANSRAFRFTKTSGNGPPGAKP